MEVGVAHGNDAAGLGHAAHLPQRRDGVGQVLEHLVGVDEVEGLVLEVEIVDVAGLELHVGHATLDGQGLRLGDDVR